MQDKILRLLPTERQERIKLLDFEINNDELFVDIFRNDYSADVSGYFLRSKTGSAVILNKNLPPIQQANVIKIILNGIKQCPSSEFGFVGSDMKFTCGGHCCFEL